MASEVSEICLPAYSAEVTDIQPCLGVYESAGDLKSVPHIWGENVQTHQAIFLVPPNSYVNLWVLRVLYRLCVVIHICNPNIGKSERGRS